MEMCFDSKVKTLKFIGSAHFRYIEIKLITTGAVLLETFKIEGKIILGKSKQIRI